MGVITGFLLKTYTDLLGTLAMTNWFLMLTKVVSTIPHHTSIFTAKFNGSPGSTKDFHGFARGFYHLRHCVTLHSVSLFLSQFAFSSFGQIIIYLCLHITSHFLNVCRL